MPLPGGGDRAAWLASQLQISRTQVFRKLAGGSWDLDSELPRVAALLGHSSAELLAEMTANAQDSLHGLLAIDGTVFRCAFTIATGNTLSVGLHAVQSVEGWRISGIAKPAGAEAQPVATLTVTGIAGPRKRLIVIIDQDTAAARRLASMLESNGYGTMLFDNADELEARLQWFEAIDAFVVSVNGQPADWVERLTHTVCSSRHDKAVVCFILDDERLDTMQLDDVMLSPLVNFLPRGCDDMRVLGLLDSRLYTQPR